MGFLLDEREINHHNLINGHKILNSAKKPLSSQDKGFLRIYLEMRFSNSSLSSSNPGFPSFLFDKERSLQQRIDSFGLMTNLDY
jgi:hypothetical protein